jgi:hypothetical protein
MFTLLFSVVKVEVVVNVELLVMVTLTAFKSAPFLSPDGLSLVSWLMVLEDILTC